MTVGARRCGARPAQPVSRSIQNRSHDRPQHQSPEKPKCGAWSTTDHSAARVTLLEVTTAVGNVVGADDLEVADRVNAKSIDDAVIEHERHLHVVLGAIRRL